MNGKQQPQGTRTVYGTCAGIISLGPLDFVWGIMINNTLVWPTASIWSLSNWQVNQVLLVSGTAYQTPIATTVDPPGAPWVLYASPWSAGTYAANSKVVRGGAVWLTLAINNLAPPAAPPSANQRGTGFGLTGSFTSNGWTFVGAPQVFATSAQWGINSIVAWLGRLYTNPAATTAIPPTAPWRLWYQPRAGFPNPLKITIGGYGDAYIYWGTSNQTLDTVNEQTLNQLNHPAYRYRAVLVIKDFLFGTETTVAPDIQVLGGRTPNQTLITGASATMDADWQVNPWCVLAEMLTDPVIGLGLPSSFFDPTTWQAEADRCALNPQLYYISPVYTSLTKVRDLVGQLMGYPDTFIFWNAIGKLQAGHWPHGENAPAFDNTTTVNRDVLVNELSGTSEGWGGTFNNIEVSFDDIQAAFKNRSVTAPNLFNKNLTKRLLAQKVDRQFIVRASQALAWASETAKISGDVFSDYDSECRAERLTGVKPGSLFQVTDDVLQATQTHRCLAKTLSALPKGTVKLKHQLERGVSPTPYSPTPLTTTPPTGAGPKPIANFQFAQLPAALGGGPSRLACLACRQNSVTNALQFWYQQKDNNSFQLLGTAHRFAISGLLTQSINIPQISTLIGIVTAGNTYSIGTLYPWAVVITYGLGGGPPSTTATEGTDYTIDYVNGTVTILTSGAIATGSNVNSVCAASTRVLLGANTSLDDIEALAAAQTKDQIADNDVLLFLFQAANPSLFEICTVTQITAVGGDYDFYLKRQQYGTLAGGDGSHVFTANDIAVAVFRRDIVAMYHQDFPQLQVAAGVANFILSPGSPYGQDPITDIFDPIANPNGLSTNCSYTFENIYAPTVTWVNELVNGATLTFGSPFLTTDKFRLTMLIQAPEGDAVETRWFAQNGSTIIEVGHALYPPVRTRTEVAEFTISSDGTWLVNVTVTDQSGNVKTFPLTAVGGGSPQPLTIDSSGGTVCSAPVASPTGDSYPNSQLVTLTCATAGVTMYYSLVALGAPPGAYTTYTGPIRVPLYGPSTSWTLYTYASKAGLTNSYPTFNDYTWESNL